MNPDATAPSIRPPRQHLPGLDGLRGLAILAVMCHHLLPPNYPNGIPGGAVGTIVKVFYRLFDIGWWGVDLFFVLSGFLITGILLEAKGSAHYFRNFYARRTLRIFPLYYGVLVLLFVVLPWLVAMPVTRPWTEHFATDLLEISRANAPLQGWLWFYGANIRMAMAPDGWIFGLLTHFWSLSVEEHFYLIWPFVVFFCSTKTLARMCLAVAAAAMLCRVGFLMGGLVPAYIYVTSPCRFDGLVLGAFVAVLIQVWKDRAGAENEDGNIVRLGFWQSTLLLLRIEPPAGATGALLRGAFQRIFVVLLPLTILTLLTCPRFGVYVVVVGHSLFAATFAAGLPGAALATASSAWRHGRWLYFGPLQTLGKYSYGLYVLHPFVLEPLGKLLSGASVQAMLGNSYICTVILRFALGLPLCLLFAWLVWHGFEKHFLRLKNLFPAKEPALAAREQLSTGLSPMLSPAE